MSEERNYSPNVIGSQGYFQLPQDFGGFLNPPAEFLNGGKS